MDDSKSKALNWTGNIYNTIEGFVPDVDDIQDTFTYVENRVTSVGGSLRKFYSSVVLDFFPHSVDPTTESEAESEFESNAEAEAEPTEPEPYSASSADQSTEPEEDSGLKLEEAKPVTTPEEEEEEEEEKEKDIERAFYSLMISVSEPSLTDGELSDEKSNASENESSVIPTSGECCSSGCGSETSTMFYSASPQMIRRSLTDVSSLCLIPFDLSPIVCDRGKERNNGPIVETPDLPIESNDDSGVETMETISLQNDDKEEKVKLENSCVIVDDMALHAVSRRAQRLASYKNKLRAIFASKKRLVKEYEQLAIWYGDANIEPTPSSESSQPSRSCDLDWELL